MGLVDSAAHLRDTLNDYPDRAPIGAVTTILNPLDYAWDNHATYLTRFAPPGHTVEAIFLGMNPGPWGMAQTGIPFGTSKLVREFLGITGEVRQPKHTHPKRPIYGIHCKTQEVSGTRLWGAIRTCFGTPEAFFARFFVANYCPLAFQTAAGGNVTPDKLPKSAWEAISRACQAHLRDTIVLLKPKTVIGIGKWAEKQAAIVIAAHTLPTRTATILHPSPANPAANTGWYQVATAQLTAIGHPWPSTTGK